AGGFIIVLRLLTAVGLAMLVTMTTRLSDMIDVVQWLLRPFARFGVNTRALELGIALVIRFTPTLADKGRQLGLAWRARARARSKPRWRVILPFTVLAIDDAEQVAEAMRARGGVNPPANT
ncbi:MAG: CbiQ family ECF transporter T component, partial [Devosiaceae bacterium]